MSKVENNRPFRAEVPDHLQLSSNYSLALIPAMAWGACARYGDKPLSEAQWVALLRKLRFPHDRITFFKYMLPLLYPAALSFDEWCDLFTELAADHVLATKYHWAR
jgi:hypothetical protein